MHTLPYQEFELATGTEDNCNAGKTNAVIVFISKEIFPACFCFVCFSCSMLLLHARFPARMGFAQEGVISDYAYFEVTCIKVPWD